MSDKALDVTSSNEFPDKVPDTKTAGDPDTWKLVCKASSVAGGWMKSTKAMLIPGFGVLVQVSSFQDGRVAEAVTSVEGASLQRRPDGTHGIFISGRNAHVGLLRAEDGLWLYGE
jgi:hypothetical protein